MKKNYVFSEKFFWFFSFFFLIGFFCFPFVAFSQDAGDLVAVTSELSAATAEAACGPKAAVPCPPEGLGKFFKTLGEKIISPQMQVVYLTTILDLAQYVADRVAYEAAVTIASGGKGETPLFYSGSAQELWQNFGQDVAGEAIGALSNTLEAADIHFNLCAPSDPIVQMGFQLGIKGVYRPPKPKCEWRSIKANWQVFVERAGEIKTDPTTFVMKEIQKGLRPGQNALSAGIRLNVRVHNKVLETKKVSYAEALAQDGFKNVVDVVTGKVKTPASVLKEQFNRELENAKETGQEASLKIAIEKSELGWSILNRTASVFLNTLLSEWMSRTYTGLFETDEVEIDVFDSELASITNKKQAQDFYGDYVSATPTSLTNYSVLSEFVICPSGSANRQINNCVMDANFSNAVTRGGAGISLTVAEAVEQGLLHGEWALYPSEDITRNQDPFCYTYGYCYGNLVKMRKARIIPIGWELAASSPYNSQGNPVTLREAVNDFEKCNSDGKADAGHPWCHLIDPNWVLKYPETQCRSYTNGELLVTQLMAGRGGVCVDAPSCIAEDSEGNCIGGYGYCTREKNTWRFRGDDCPEPYASCLSFTNTYSSAQTSWLLNTVDFGNCSSENAGCLWYRTNKSLDDQETDNETDDTYVWLPTTQTYVVASEEAKSGAYKDRIYFTHQAETCSETDVGCQKLFEQEEGVSLNLLRNPSFEDDVNTDGIPDDWSVSTAFTISEEADDADVAVLFDVGSSQTISQKNIPLQQGQFYTLSAYAKKTGQTNSFFAQIDFQAADGSAVDLSKYSTTCKAVDINTLSLLFEGATETFQRFSCTFSTPSFPNGIGESIDVVVSLSFIGSSAGFFLDSVQLEPQSSITDFHEGYSQELQTASLKVAPDWLSCTGKETDSVFCKEYAQVCSATEVGCNLYTPENGGPDIPASVTSLDQCPVECVGYGTFKQEATVSEQEVFPVYFIPSTAQSCSAQQVGCDEFTNLETEATEAYSTLRACVSPEMNAGASYYTWEGSDVSGYQLVSWQLLKSNTSNAPCTHWNVSSVSELVCADTSSDTTIDDCDEHSDIFENPDCREFYDEQGKIHYRLYSQTVSVTEACTAYRKTLSLAQDVDEANLMQTDCLASQGFWTGTECRYFLEPSESISCPTSAVGCRSYTGGAGRNSATIFSELFEQGSFASFTNTGASELTMSNESVATDGHSLRVVADDQEGIETLHAYYDATDNEEMCEQEAGCPVTNIGSYKGSCLVEQGQNDCGPLVESLIKGKTYLLKVWAKGSGNLRAALVDHSGAGDQHYFEGSMTLEGGWKLYTLGPLDTQQDGFADFDDSAVLRFYAEGSATFYLDNIELIQAQENMTLIKNSWVTPSVCDQTSAGTFSPQYYLGCESYTDIEGQNNTLYQFEHVCEEASVGCKAYYQTQNSSSVYTQIFQARCFTSDGLAAKNIQDCLFEGESVCQILTGQTFCLFDADQNLPVPLPSNIVLGPEARIVPADKLIYLINDGTAVCSAEAAGCTEFGKPTLSTDRTLVDSFDSVYVLDLPDTYDNLLCHHEELFCEEWASTQDGNYYFKDPGEQTCEYKSSVTINNQQYSGWFRTGTNEFCYGKGVCTEDQATVCSTDADCSSRNLGTCRITSGTYIQGGNVSAVWLNGDQKYEGWVAGCENKYDLCTEFVDPLDTATNQNTQGQSYFFLNNDSIGEAGLQSVQKCSGQVSLALGCTLFEDKVNSSLLYNASASYLVSQRADEFFGEGQSGSLQNPVDCYQTGAGVFTVRGENIDICQRRCQYSLNSDGTLDAISSVQVEGTNTYYTHACLDNKDCPVLQDSLRNDVQGTCKDVDDPTDKTDDIYRLKNDSNTVLKVYRDRECSQWLACSSWTSAWDEREGRYRNVCTDTDLCTEYSTAGDSAFCSRWIQEQPLALTMDVYTGRDTSWYGQEYSGHTIPEQLPVQFYEPININPPFYCVDVNGFVQTTPEGDIISCLTGDDCSGSFCEEAEKDYRLAYVAGTCSQDRGERCSVGFCSRTGTACTQDLVCEEDETCLVGYCEETPSSPSVCLKNSDCTSSTYNTCKNGVCIDSTTSAQTGGEQEGCFTSIDCTRGECVPAALAKTGLCYNENCLLDINGGVFQRGSSEQMECRGYPEITSPFSTQVVQTWVDPNHLNTTTSTPTTYYSKPYDFVYGFQGVDTCAPYLDSNGTLVSSDDCLCSYDKVSYGTGTGTKYFPENTSTGIPEAICVGGKNPGAACGAGDVFEGLSGDDICDQGTCEPLTRKDTYLGWDGYCIERDSSIQTNGGTQISDRACLTWLPVDQTAGSTDLYAKYTEAGYEEKDTYYCAEMDVAYTIATSTQPACAETQDGSCEDEVPDSSFFSNTNCWKSAFCPRGYFGVITGCGDAAPMDMCRESAFTDDDCPFFCVPELSFHTDNSDNNLGDPCSPPTSDAVATKRVSINDTTDWDDYQSTKLVDYTLYALESGKWSTKFDEYKDCQVKGLSQTGASNYLKDFSNDDNDLYVQPGSTGNSSGYRDLVIPVYSQLSCKSLVQVASSNRDTFNKAWTDRTWYESPQAGSRYTIYTDGVLQLAYETKEEYMPFGVSVSPSDWEVQEDQYDPYPILPALCKSTGDGNYSMVIGYTDGTCPSGYTMSSSAQSGDFSRPFYNVSLELASETVTDTCRTDADCNEGVECIKTSDDEDAEKICNKGELAGNTCEDDEDCQKLKCREVCGGSIGGGGGGGSDECENTAFRCTLDGSEVSTSQYKNGYRAVYHESYLDAVNRLKQIFAESFGYQLWKQGKASDQVIDSGLDPSELWQEYQSTRAENWFGEYEASSNSDWQWDITSEGYQNTEPTPPTTRSVGICYDNLCEEGAEGTFSVNELDTGVIFGTDGQKHVNVKFFAYADADQMPIKNVIVDWGDARHGGEESKGLPWPTNSQTGSNDDGNFYKNHRGLTEGTGKRTDTYCDDEDEWGHTSDSCDASYFNFENDYLCNKDMLKDSSLPTCDVADDGRLTNSPCLGGAGIFSAYPDTCVFQPRVHVKDNWGWCTGYCDSDPDGDNSINCYQSECNTDYCPSENESSSCVDYGPYYGYDKIVNPWINFDGYIIIEP